MSSANPWATGHNFSPYFYLLYLQPDQKRSIGLAALLPQLAMVLRFTLAYHEDLPFALTLITVVFVAFNKCAARNLCSP
eukprot:COSAG04_NODE_4_length_52282_cov_12.667133_27_plen_79_part_00